MRLVLDASVAVKWVLPSRDEPLSAEAEQLLAELTDGRVSFLVPDLFWIELANILWKSSRSGRMSPAAAVQALDTLQNLPLSTTSSRTLASDALQIASTWNRSAYDAAYIALALQTGHALLTADERLVNAVGTHLPVRWLGALA